MVCAEWLVLTDMNPAGFLITFCSSETKQQGIVQQLQTREANCSSDHSPCLGGVLAVRWMSTVSVKELAVNTCHLSDFKCSAPAR